MAKAAATTPYFESHSSKMNLWVANGGHSVLRNCQLGAFWSVWSHFTASDRPALVSLPTGAGKTGLMMTLAFGLKARRVLVVTPATILRDQVRDEFASLSLLKSLMVVPKTLTLPQVVANETQRGTVTKWKELEAFDVVVATPKTTSPGEPGVCHPPGALFDLVFIDERTTPPHRHGPLW